MWLTLVHAAQQLSMLPCRTDFLHSYLTNENICMETDILLVLVLVFSGYLVFFSHSKKIQWERPSLQGQIKGIMGSGLLESVGPL